VIRTRIKALHFSDGWEYSNGCAFEFAVGRDAGLPSFDATGRPLSPEDGRARLAGAVRDLEAEGFDAAGVRSAICRLG
jgi:hypothetical protein